MQIETSNLVLSQFTTDDAPFFKILVNTPGWLQQIGDRGIKTDEDARNYLLKGPIDSYKKNGYGPMLVKLKSNDIPIGLCGLVKRDALEHVDIGFALLPGYEGKGFAYEASTAILAFAKNHLNLDKVVAIALPTNTRSIKLLERLGLRFEQTIHIRGDEEELVLMGKSL